MANAAIRTGPGVYMIYCHENGKAYIGSSNRVNLRFNHHRHYLRTNKHGNQHLQNAWNLYGEDSFSFGVIQPCPDGEQLMLEQYYLDVWFDGGSVFNRHMDAKSPRGNKWTESERLAKSIAMKANPPFKGRRHSEESKALLSNAHKAWATNNPNPFLGKKHSEASRALISEKAKGHTRSRGRKLSEKAKALISAANSGRIQSDETRAKISAAMVGQGNPRFGVHISAEQKQKAAKTLARRTDAEIAEFKAKMSATIRNLPKKTDEEMRVINAKRRATLAATLAAIPMEERARRKKAHAEALRTTRAKNRSAMSPEDIAAKKEKTSANIKAAIALRTDDDWKRIAENRKKATVK